MVVGDLATAVDIVVLGAGPGGYVAAIHAAQLGKQVAIIDPGLPGGSCLHDGCIPSKSLLAAADQLWQLSNLNAMGISVGKAVIDLPKMQRWKDRVVKRLVDGVQQLLTGNKVEIVSGLGWFLSENEIRVEGEYGAKRFSFDQCVIAVGGNPAPWPNLPFDKRVITPGNALRLTVLPDNLAVIGSDYIAAEQATYFIKLGVPVRLIIPEDQRLLSQFDPAAGRQVQARLKKLGVKIENKVSNPVTAVADAAMVSVSNGIIPRTGDLNLDVVGIQTDAYGFIRVDDRMNTGNPAIYAVGDVTGGAPLAMLAIKQGKIAAECIAGRPARYAPQAIPRVAWTDPEVAAVGLTAAEAEAAGYKVITGRFPMGANGRALTLDRTLGFGLVVAEEGTEVLLGMTVVGHRAPELIGEAALALEMGATLTDLAETLHPHPGLGEVLQESAEAVLGMAVHIL